MYKHDGLSGIRNISGPESEMIKKKLCKIFIQHGLNVTVECNLRITDFLDITFDLRTKKYCPYRKVKNELIYIHKDQTTHHLSPSKFLQWPVKEYPTFHVIQGSLAKLSLTTITDLKQKNQIYTTTSSKKKTQQKQFMI